MIYKSKAYSLIELVLVIVILGILATVALHLVVNPNNSNTEVLKNKVLADISLARQYAMTNKGTVYGVYFDSGNNQYTVYQETIATPIQNPLTKQNLIEDLSQYPSAAIVSDYIVEFNSIGQAITGGDGIVQIATSFDMITLTVSANTGHIIVTP